jgi:hypothetical protein
MATIIKTDGTEKPLASWDLKTLQDIVGGYIEGFFVGKRFMYVNEDGKAKGLAVNKKATAIFQAEYGKEDSIVGDVVFLTEEETAKQNEELEEEPSDTLH